MVMVRHYLKPFMGLRPSLAWLDIFGYWPPWFRAACWWWSTPR